MAKGDTKTVFPSELQTISNISAEFAVRESVAMVRVKGLKAGDELRVEFEMGDECEQFWVPLVGCCEQVKLSHPETYILLALPMKYRLVLMDAEGAFMTDPSHFSDVLIQVNNVSGRGDLAKYYNGCCDKCPTTPTDGDCGCDICSELGSS